MKKLMIAAGLGLMFTMLSVMPAMADGPRNDNRFDNHNRGYDRHEIRNDRKDIRNDRRDFREDRRDVRFDRRDNRDNRRDGASGERFDHHQDYHQDGRVRR